MDSHTKVPGKAVKEWCAVSAHHSLTQPCGPKPRQWKASLKNSAGAIDFPPSFLL